MSDTVIVALLALSGTIAGSWMGVRQANKVVELRLKNLEEKVSKHNNLVERMAISERDIKTAHHRIDKIEKDVDAFEHEARHA